jgi:regulator of protease activity HflC (stomatin/prohibitin superfamily)
MADLLWIPVVAVVLFFIAIKAFPLKRVIVYQYQQALRYRKGRYIGTLGPGQYWIFPKSSSIVPVDTRPEFITIQGQDVLSADGVTLKISLAAQFQVADPHVAVNKNANYRTSLYLSLQMALREIVGAEKIDALLDNRAQISSKLMELISKKASEFGLTLISADVKDIMFPGEMKRVFAQVVKAQKEGQAALERARGETAALRNLANAARTMDENPSLLQLRALQTLADSPGNTLVLGLPNAPIPLPKRGERTTAEPGKTPTNAPEE